MKSIIIKGKQMKDFRTIAKLFSNMGFTKINVSKKSIILEKSLGKNLEGNLQMDYSILFEKNQITFNYNETEFEKRLRYFQSIKILINLLIIAKDYYYFEPEGILALCLDNINFVEKTVKVSDINLSEKIDFLEHKNKQLLAKYQDLVKSSEENARLLFEAERRSEEIIKKLSDIEVMSDETLKEELFEWIKIHSGSIDLSEFSNSFNIPKKRVEDGINLLIKEGYIRKR